LRSLQERGLARAERFGGSPLGDELWSVTPLGVQTLEAAQALAQRSVSPPASEAASAPRSVSPPAPAEAPRDVASSLQQEADLLRKLGELAEKRGDTQQAARYYEEALGLIRKLHEPSTD
jgi:hypothetical protein